MPLYAEFQGLLLEIIKLRVEGEYSRLYFSLHFAIVDGLGNRIMHVLDLQLQFHLLRCLEDEIRYFLDYHH